MLYAHLSIAFGQVTLELDKYVNKAGELQNK